jgi:hypothetical protein
MTSFMSLLKGFNAPPASRGQVLAMPDLVLSERLYEKLREEAIKRGVSI